VHGNAGKAGSYFGAFLGFTNLKQTEPREPLNPLAHDPAASARLFDETDAIIRDALHKQGLSGDSSGGALLTCFKDHLGS
jgi:hypothetical protein